MQHLFLAHIFVLSVLVTLAESTRKTPADIPEPPYSNECRLLINEVNLFSTNLHQFVEIGRYCDGVPKNTRSSSMSLFNLIFISSDGHLLGKCELQGSISHSVSDYSFYTLGTSETPNLNMDINDCELVNRNPIDQTKFMLPVGISKPIGMALLYNERIEVLRKIKLGRTADGFVKTKITSNMEKRIMKNLNDFYLVASSSPYVYCDYFSKFYTGYSQTSVGVLRDWTGNPAAADMSLNRCSKQNFRTNTSPFQPQFFKYSTPTPGKINACRTGFHYAPEFDQPARKRLRSETNEVEHDDCYSYSNDPELENNGYIQDPDLFQQNFDRAARNAIIQPEFEIPSAFITGNDDCSLEDAQNGIEEERTSGEGNKENITETPQPETDFVNSDDERNEYDVDTESSKEDEINNSASDGAHWLESDEENDNPDSINEIPYSRYTFVPHPVDNMLFEETLSQVPKYIHNDCTHFPEVTKTKLLEQKLIDISEVMKDGVCNWVEVLPENNKFRCKFCHALLNQNVIFDRPKSKLVTSIMTRGAGYHIGNKIKNQNKGLIVRHKSNPLHLVAEQYFKLFDQGLRGKELQEKFEAEDSLFRQYMMPTEQILKATFQSVQMGLTFYKFPKLTELLNHYDVDIGHLYQNPPGVKTMVMSISSSIHEKLINHLLTHQPEISIMVDCSTDIAAYSTLSVLFQTFSETGSIKIYFYKLLEITEGEKGIQLFQLFVNALKEDGLEEYFREKLYGYTSDGAPNVASVFKNRLKAFAKNPLVSVHCGCHVIELVNLHAYEGFDFLKSVDTTVNEIVKFFNPKSSKRRIILRSMTLSNKERKFELKRIKKIRWINSKKRSLKNIILHWKTIKKTLEKIVDDESFQFEARQRADNLLNSLLDGTFLITVAFVCDVSSKLSDVSVLLQKRGGTLIAKRSMRLTLLEELRAMRTVYGPYIKRLIESAEFNVPEDEGLPEKPTLIDIETKLVKIDGEPLNAPKQLNKGQALYYNMANYLKALEEQAHNYFDEDAADYLDVLDPSKFPANIQDYETYGVNEILLASRKLRWKSRWKVNDVDLAQEWSQLILSLYNDPDFAEYKLKLPEEFWSYFLLKNDVRWSPNTRKIIANVITTACTSSEVERSFSLYSAIKTQRRYSLLPSTVDALLRIRYNGGDLQHFDSLYFAKKFLVSHSRSNDVSRRRFWKKRKPSESDLDLLDENLNDPFDDSSSEW